MNKNLQSEADYPELLAQLRKCDLFSGLTDDQFERVQQHSRLVGLAADEMLFEQSQAAHEFFLLIEGQVKLARFSPEGNEKIIDIIYPGFTFAEAIMFARQPTYPVTSVALMASRVICFSAQAYTEVLHESTDACFSIMAQLSRRLHGHVAEIDRLTLHSATFRVVSYLLDQLPSTRQGAPQIQLDTPKHVIAARLSITPETLSRSFAKLNRDGLIQVKDNAILLNDVARLRQYARDGSL